MGISGGKQRDSVCVCILVCHAWNVVNNDDTRTCFTRDVLNVTLVGKHIQTHINKYIYIPQECARFKRVIVEMNECDEKKSDPPEYHWTAPNALFPAACYNCCLCKGSRKKGKVIYRYDSLPLTILFRKADFQSVAFLTSQAGGGGITQKTFLIAFRLSPLSSPTNFFTALVLLSLNQDLRAIYLALFTVHCDCIFLAKQQGKQCFCIWSTSKKQNVCQFVRGCCWKCIFIEFMQFRVFFASVSFPL